MPELGEIEDFLLKEASLIMKVEKQALVPETTFKELGLDSMALLELLLSIERKYGVQMLHAGLDAKDMRSFRSLAGRIARELGEA